MSQDVRMYVCMYMCMYVHSRVDPNISYYAGLALTYTHLCMHAYIQGTLCMHALYTGNSVHACIRYRELCACMH